jgi:hypothetical protein
MTSNNGIGKVIPITIIVLVAVGVAFLGYHLLAGRGGANGGAKENVPIENGEPKGVEFKTYTNENYSFKFDYPDNWDFTELRQWSSQGFNAPFVSENILDAFVVSENILENNWWRIGLIVYSKTVIASQYGENSLDNLVSWLSRWGITTYIEYTKDNYPAVNYAGVTPSTQFRGTLAVKDNRLYQLTVETPEENYSISEPIFQHVIHSFYILV